jgi:hypothetical protein
MNFKHFFYISIYFQDCPSYELFCLNQKNELGISFNRRVCSFFSDSLALFENFSEAQNFLSTLKVDENRIYSISEISSTSRQINPAQLKKISK